MRETATSELVSANLVVASLEELTKQTVALVSHQMRLAALKEKIADRESYINEINSDQVSIPHSYINPIYNEYRKHTCFHFKI